MNAANLVAVVFAAATTLAVATPPGIEPVSPELIAEIKGSVPGPDAIFIWDGSAELILRVSVVDAATQKPIAAAKATAVRDRRVANGPDRRAYQALAPRATDWRGRATLKGRFPAAGNATGFSVFVVDSYVAVGAPGYVSTRARISSIYRLDFARKTKDCEVPIRIAMHTKGLTNR